MKASVILFLFLFFHFITKTSTMGEEVVDEMSKMTSSTSSSSQVHFILVHGASHGGWCWYKVRTLLETSGYMVTCLDLKASGIDSSDVDSVESFQDYNQPLVDLLASLPDHHKVIFVFSLPPFIPLSLGVI